MVTYVIYFTFIGKGILPKNIHRLEYNNSLDAFTMATKLSQSDHAKLISLDIVTIYESTEK